MNIVVTGSLGNIGQPLTETLIKDGHSVKVISSHLERKESIERLGATAAIGNLADVDFLANAFKGADSAFCMIPPDYTNPDQLGYYETIARSYEQAVKASAIGRVVFLSSYGADLPAGTGFITGSYKSEQILNSITNIALTHIRPSFFYYNLLAFIGMIRSAGFIGSVYGGEDRLTMVAPKDIAVAVAEELTKTDNIKHIRYVASDDRTCREIAAVLGEAIGIPGLKWLVLPKEEVLRALKNNGMPEEFANKYVELGEAIHTGKLRADYDKHTPALGTVTLEAYAVEFAKVFADK
ncbi:NAD(P)H-binding protein [Chitinophaga pendula]|uniref:NmrA family NAD(P)-binding protein n=1 Tax=Chitinophaga TaxID=79328 RepID=UPI000BAEAE14|nr:MULTISPECIES: NAD(P)H-binding protein [Chitinophaga]ASZ12127.1 NAD-dependent dehydratase [Chitinophaga sp. MD30]UCJ04834.1 NAD(P)H-binding protein [Chitinophaga pendula]